ncbi:MAG TPA: type III-B CRISPR module RAMP protein Cmr1 [Candidatus Atribacteria bacterium]|nr:type III-B CRISPR module RAMP protein Cmr1 [Candidatus Atribacteria bacterium]
MGSRTLRITIKTLTPLWTGDAWRENNSIQPSSIMGSLRFWFEVICYFAGITKNENYEGGKLKDDLNEKEFKEKLLNNGLNFKGIDNTLSECNVSFPSKLFGCTGWKGWVRIKKIEPIEDYCFGNKLKLPFGVAIKKDFSEIKELNNFRELDKNNYSGWFFSKSYFYGKFEITFEIEENIIEPIFYPILVFIEKYGFLGGKWNIGYGRVGIENVSDNVWDSNFYNKSDNEVGFKFKNTNSKKISELINSKNGFSTSTPPFEFLKFFLNIDSFYCSNEREIKNKISNLPVGFRIAKLDNNFNDFIDVICTLLKIKAKIRNYLRPDNTILNKQEWNNFRHEILGTISGGTEGTKIIPWIYEDDGELKGGFISIVGIINSGGN